MAVNFDFIIAAFDMCFWWVWLMRFCVTTGVALLNKISDGSLTHMSTNSSTYKPKRRRVVASKNINTRDFKGDCEDLKDNKDNKDSSSQSTVETDSDEDLFTN